jgi:adenine-specific DNA-methyltransferase
MQTTNQVDENIKKIAELFPNCLTERLDENGKPEVAIDFDQLRQELSKDIVEGPEERYQFTWPDKRNAIRLANAPTTDTLRPCREESVDFDNTQNLYIEGDNLEVLKLLRENYLGKVKMVYIDPPYNTGNDFVYNDDFAQTTGDYVHNSGQEDEEGNRLVANTESNGRFHTDWLNMIYPRLKVAKDLLSEDGVIFISIDDNELTNIQKVCNEIFGERNFFSLTIIRSNSRGQTYKQIAKTHEYLLIITRSEGTELFELEKDMDNSDLNMSDDISNFNIRELRNRNPKFGKHNRPGLFYPIFVNTHAVDKDGFHPVSLTASSQYDLEIIPLNSEGKESCWRWGKSKSLANISDNTLQSNLVAKPKSGGGYNIYEKYRKTTYKPKSIWDDNCFLTETGTVEIKNLGFTDEFDFPKPIELVRRCIQLATSDKDFVLDFFSGSSTTAHAVMKQNSEDNCNRRFIMVQLPEIINKNGFATICDVAKERIRRAGKKIEDEQNAKQADLFSGEKKPLDIGFRVLKLDSSNMQDVYYSPEQFNENLLFEDNIKHDRTDEDLLFQAMIELGIELSAKIEKREIAGKTIWSVADNYLMACFDKDVNETTITEIARQHPYYFVLRDSSLATDNVADNFEQIWEEYSKETIRRII